MFLFSLVVVQMGALAQNLDNVLQTSASKLGYASLADVGAIRFKIIQKSEVLGNQEIIFTVAGNGDIRADIQGNDTQLSYIKNSNGYFQSFGSDVTEVNSDQIKQTLQRFNLFENLFEKLSLSNTSSKVHKNNDLLVIQSDQVKTKVSLSADSYLPTRLSETVTTINGDFNRETEFLDYQSFNGFWISTRQVTEVKRPDGQGQYTEEVTIEDVELLKTIKPSFFNAL